MPYARISLRKGKPPEYRRAISDSLHRALVETFGVPPGDRFHVIHQVDAEDLVFDPSYLGGPRSADFVLIALTIGRPRDTTAKRAFYRRLAGCLAEAPGLRPQDVMVVISATEAEDWSFADGRASMLSDSE